ncbi:MAG TPA: UDP-N-acetylmuramyl-tripeptide synthetase [Firmicutes bacterium]|nr:UDP-N-acetylmuramyl-tripeptide synthetase [Bacillota bacterium]
MSLETKVKGAMPLRALLARVPGVKLLAGDNPAIAGISTDSRTLQPGELFVAIKGERHDGHAFIPQVLERGAPALVVEDLPALLPRAKALAQVENSRLALAHLAAAFYGHPARSLICAGVTGSTGKTTTTFLLNAILEEAGCKTGLVGTVCQKVGELVSPTDVTTPEPLTLHRLFAAMKERGVSHAVMEVSSHSLCQERVAGIPYAVAVFTNLSREHLNYHGSLTRYLASKARLFTSLAPDAWAVLNLDEPAGNYLARVTGARIITYGTRDGAHLRAGRIRSREQGLSFQLTLTRPLATGGGMFLPPQQWEVELGLLGWHNVFNALGAIGAALALGIEPDIILRALHKFPGVPRRLEVVYRGAFTIIDDFGHNEASLKALFRTIAGLEYRQLVIVNYLKGSRGVEANEITARHIVRAARKVRLARVITTRSDSHVSRKNIVQDEEEAAFTAIIAAAGLPIVNTRELPEAIALGLKSVGPGDLLLLLGPSGMDAGADLALRFLRQPPRAQGIPAALVASG